MNQQLELGFNGMPTRIHGRRRETRVARAQWWFARMRAAVSGAREWSATRGATPQQIALPGVQRSLSA